MKNVTVLGSTGTIGRLTLEVLSTMPERFNVHSLAANRNIELLAAQIEKLSPAKSVVLSNDQCDILLKSNSSEILCGQEELVKLAKDPDVDIVVVAMTGTAATEAVLAALEQGKRVALATKEVLVGFGQMVMNAATEGDGEILPIDSEHNAIHQCLDGRDPETVSKIILTASGGPFRNRDYHGATARDVLNHPTWNMGARITVDSATLMNKGFEVIEARYLFGISPDKIKVLVHPQSIVHSLVELTDGSVIAQMAVPDMRLPIAYALLYPERGSNVVESLDLTSLGKLEFSQPDFKRFPSLELAWRVLAEGGTAPAVLQAADYEAVEQFLSGNIMFEEIPGIIKGALDSIEIISRPGLSQIRQAEELAAEYVKNKIREKGE